MKFSDALIKHECCHALAARYFNLWSVIKINRETGGLTTHHADATEFQNAVILMAGLACTDGLDLSDDQAEIASLPPELIAEAMVFTGEHILPIIQTLGQKDINTIRFHLENSGAVRLETRELH